MVPAEILYAASSILGHLDNIEPLSGGDVARAVRAVTAAGAVFLKWKPGAPPDLFAKEADGLARLRTAGAIRVPDVLAVGEDTPFLALEYIAPKRPNDPPRFRQRFAEGLAQLHAENPAPDGCFGLEIDNYLGSQPQPNGPLPGWGQFYRDRRLAPQIERARIMRLLPNYREQALDRILAKTEALLAELPPNPVLIHGDLWSGNFLSDGDEPVLVDPAVYYAEREVELAYIDLFGGFPAGFVDCYRRAYPLSGGYESRRPLHQLYPLLIHLNHFGETYGPAVDRACADCLQTG
jgi:fructosamine-3-kinase